jgi:hypothetical protein
MRKVFSVSTGDNVTEYSGISFEELLEKHKGYDVTIKLELWQPVQYGYTFLSEAIIGNTRDNLTKEDYYRAYDKVTA